MLTDSTTWHELAPALIGEHLQTSGAGAVVELGVWQGELSQRLLALPLLTQLFMVDPWQARYLVTPEGKWYISGPGNNQDEMEHAYALAQTVEAQAQGRATIIRKPSVEAAADIPDESLAAVIVDAEHFKDQVIADIEAWLPKLRPGGLMIGDDFGEYFPGVQVGVEAVFGRHYRVLGQTWWTFPHTQGGQQCWRASRSLSNAI